MQQSARNEGGFGPERLQHVRVQAVEHPCSRAAAHPESRRHGMFVARRDLVHGFFAKFKLRPDTFFAAAPACFCLPSCCRIGDSGKVKMYRLLVGGPPVEQWES